MNLLSSTHYDKLIARAQTLSAAPCAIAHPCDEPSLSAALEARDLACCTPSWSDRNARSATPPRNSA